MDGPTTTQSARAGKLELRALSKRYAPGDPLAVDSLSLTVPAGQVCVLVGPSGCGKTTALKMVNRLIEPTDGDILIDDRSVRDRPAAELRRDIGYVIQQVGLLPHLTIGANITTVPRLLGWDRPRMRARATELLGLIGLDPERYVDRYPAELSGGQQQRVGLARALAADPPLMLMDEPFSAVDPITRERLQNDFLRLHRQVPKTVVFVSHDIDEAVKMADLIAVMDQGRLVQCATPADLLANPANDFVADFVGADRALKGLSLSRVEELDPAPAPIIVVDEPLEAVSARIDAGELTPIGGAVLVVDRHGAPLRWRRLTDLGRVPSDQDTAVVEPLIDAMDTQRDALSALVESSSTHGVVVQDGVVQGVVSIEDIIGRLTPPVPTESAARHG
ncbi:MAG: ABC transporter ATP-binding protein [Thermoleophilia bacterium]